jgi:uncharacterized protein YhbP (UPF0306 family)
MSAVLTNIRTIGVDGMSIATEAPSLDRVHRSLYRVLDDTPLCAWATVTADRHAHIHTGYFAHSDRLELYPLSHPGSVHCRNVIANPSMAVAVFASAQNWTQPGCGTQLFGTCRPVASADAAEVERIYARRFPAYANWKTTLKAGDPALNYRFYRFIPDHVKILDEAEFGDAVWIQAEIVRA